MGFYTKYWSTLLKGPGATRFKIRVEVRRIENFYNKASHLLFHEFPRLIEKEHRVTKFLKVFKEFITDIKKVGENCFRVLFNESTQDMAEFREVHAILQDIGEFWKKMPRKKVFKEIELNFLLHIINALKDDEIKERGEYRLIEAIIDETANPEKGHQKLMAMLRDKFRKMDRTKLEDMFEKVAWRREARISKQMISATKSHKKALDRILKKIVNEKNDNKLQQLASELQNQLAQIQGYVAKMFKESYYVKERAIIMVLRIIYLVMFAERYLSKESRESLIPNEPTKEGELSLDEALEHLGKDFHNTISQEFRIVVHDVEALEREAEALRRQP